MDTKATIAEAERFGRCQAREFDVKVPATPEGLPAIQHLIGEGISINITLLFSQKVYVQVAQAYLAGLEKYVAKGGDPSHVASVASFFVSRIGQRGRQSARRKDRTGQRSYREGAAGRAERQDRDRQRQARLPGIQAPVLRDALGQACGQRRQAAALAVASTGTQEQRLQRRALRRGADRPNTVNTVPPATLDAFRDHGTPRDSLEENIEDARGVLAELETSGISLDAITPIWSRTASICLPMPPTSFTARRPQARSGARGWYRPPGVRARKQHRQGGGKEHRGLARVRQNPPALAAR